VDILIAHLLWWVIGGLIVVVVKIAFAWPGIMSMSDTEIILLGLVIWAFVLCVFIVAPESIIF